MYLEVWQPCAHCGGTGERDTNGCPGCNPDPYLEPVPHPGFVRVLVPVAEVLAFLKEGADA